jgi:hypothetical protein
MLGYHFYNQGKDNQTCDDPAFNSKLFESLYLDFERMCYKGSIPIRDLAPLHNFDVSDLKRSIRLDKLIVEGLGAYNFEPLELQKNHILMISIKQGRLIILQNHDLEN